MDSDKMDNVPSPGPTVTDLITITIKTIDSKNYQFQVENNIQIKELKEKIAPTLGIDVESQRMIFCGRVLADDKTLQFYKIDNGKVIHVVKRTTPPVKNDTPNNNENNQHNDRNNQSRFRSFRNDDGSSVLMGTFSVDPPANILNQVMRHLFFNRGGSSGGQSDGSPDSNSQSNTASNESLIRARFNQIRQLHSYIETNFNILQNPSYLPRSQHVINAFPENQPITIRDYEECFNDTLNYFDRLRPYLNETLNSLNPNNNNNDNNNDTTSSDIADSAQNSSIIMRVAHHLSHVLHALTDLSVDRSNPNSPTIKLNTLNTNSQNPMFPFLQTSNSGGDNSGNTNNNNNNNAGATNANQTNTSTTGNADNANISFTVETNINRTQSPNSVSNTSTTTTATSASTSTTTSSSSPADIFSSITTNVNNPLPRTLGSGTFPGGVLVTQSPILLMEVDATIDGHRTNLGTRTVPNFSLSDFNITFNNMISNAANVTLNSMNLNNMSSSASQSTSSSNSYSAAAASSNNNANSTDSDANNQSSQQAESTGQQTRPTTANNAADNNGGTASNSAINPLQAFSMRFDPFLTCNSTYTLPEIRSATNLGPLPLENLDASLPDALRQIINEISDPERDGENDTPNDFDIFTELANLLNLDSSSSNRPEIDDSYQAFFDFIRFLSQNAQQLSPALSLDMEGNSGTVRIGDYMRRFNLFHSDDDSLMSRMMQLLFQNLSFEDFYQIINFNFNNFGRLRQPLQEFIRTNLLTNNQEYSIENISLAIENILSDNENVLINITQNLKPVDGVNVVKSLRIFLKETLVKFLDSIMRSSSDDGFENDVVTAVTYLISCYIHFCNACFASPEESRIRLIQNYLEQYPEMVEPRFRTLIVALIKGRIDAISQNLSDDYRKEVNDRIVFEERSASTSISDNNQQQPMDSLPDHEEPSNSYDSEEVEFADACSEIPSTSSVSVAKNSYNNDTKRNADSIKSLAEPADWENVVPNDWIPIVKEDLEKQKNIDDEHPPPFSDAYLSGMSKKRRYEHDQSQSK